jgi:hypothetical protein
MLQQNRPKRQRSLAAALLLVLAATMLHSIGGPLQGGLVLWFAMALGIGLVLGRWWALLLAAIPWPLGVGVGLGTGRYAFLGEAWQGVAAVSMLTGLAGIALGVRTRQAIPAVTRRVACSRRR